MTHVKIAKYGPEKSTDRSDIDLVDAAACNATIASLAALATNRSGFHSQRRRVGRGNEKSSAIRLASPPRSREKRYGSRSVRDSGAKNVHLGNRFRMSMRASRCHAAKRN